MLIELTVDQVLLDLKELGDPRALAVWAKLGLDTETYLGVNLTKLKKYARGKGKNTAFAQQLWDSGIHDAQLLATMLAQPKDVSEELARQWATEARFWDLTDKLAELVLCKTDYGLVLALEWIATDGEWLQRAGYITVVNLIKGKKEISSEHLDDILGRIRQTITDEKNWVREAMLYVLIRIGCLDEARRQQVLDIMDEVGSIDIDYGDTSCKPPDVVRKLGG